VTDSTPAAPRAPKPVMLLILDGFGWREEEADNAVRLADTPVFDRLWQDCPHAFLRTSGADVGLPDGQMGNSEVGHLNIGAGRVVMQELPRIGRALANGSLATNPVLTGMIDALRKTGGACHLVGLVSPGGVHAHQDHAAGLARILSAAGVRVLVHAITDGRDGPPRAAGEDIARLRAALPEAVSIATVCGRYYAMDRDNRWERVAKAVLAIGYGQGPRFADAASVVDDAYGHDVTDEFVVPACVGGYRGMADGDALLCFNFRADRVRELLTALVDPGFDRFPRPRPIAFAAAAGMTRYSDDLAPYLGALFAPQSLARILGEVVSEAGGRQLRLAETEKYPHVTYFLNGGQETPYAGEDRVMVPSPKVATYDLQPEMSAPELTDRAVEAIGSGSYDLIVMNYANPDMVGHTGSLPAAIRAVETVDAGLGRIAQAIEQAGGALLVTADHGNAEQMRDPETGGPHTAHTTNPVPVLLLGAGDVALADGRLGDLAPTLLALMGIAQPAEMTGESLLRRDAARAG
jgi:2,3-bisphosphoglycerate-independent phosphoglycerate mutase